MRNMLVYPIPIFMYIIKKRPSMERTTWEA